MDGNPALGEHFEWLVRDVQAKAARAGVRLDDAVQQEARLEISIAGLRDMIHAEQSVRSVIIALPEAAPSPPVAPVVPVAAEP